VVILSQAEEIQLAVESYYRLRALGRLRVRQPAGVEVPASEVADGQSHLEADGGVSPVAPVYEDPAVSPRAVAGYRRMDGSLVFAGTARDEG
jgi:hypothetical protein